MEKLTKALMTDETGQAIVTKLTALSGQMHELAMATRGSAILFESESDISVLGDGGYLAVYVGSTNPLVISGWTGDNSLVTGHLYYLIKSGTDVASRDLGEYGGSAVTDTTLSVSGAPADAKTVGDALATKADSSDVTALTTVVAGKADSADVTALDARVTAQADDVYNKAVSKNLMGMEVGKYYPVDIPQGTQLVITRSDGSIFPTDNVERLYMYDADRQYVDYASLKTGTNYKVTPGMRDDVAYLRWYDDNGGTYDVPMMVVTLADRGIPYAEYFENVRQLADRYNSGTAEISGKIESLSDDVYANAVSKNLMGMDFNMYRVNLSTGDYLTVTKQDGSVFDIESTQRLYCFDSRKRWVQSRYLNHGTTYETFVLNQDVSYLQWGADGLYPITVPMMVAKGNSPVEYTEYFKTVRTFDNDEEVTPYYSRNSATSYGVTFTWSDGVCTINGTANHAGYSVNNYLLKSSQNKPLIFEVGKKLYIHYHATSPAILFEIDAYKYDEGTGTYKAFDVFVMRGPGWYIVPADTERLALSIRIQDGTTVIGKFSDFGIFETYPKKRIEQCPNLPLLVTLTDDDTLTDEDVEHFHGCLMHNGVQGGYAFIGRRVEEAGTTTISKMQEVEDDGFDVLPHCWTQATYFLNGETRDLNECMSNMVKIKRYMAEHQLMSQDQWIVPYGVTDEGIRHIAKSLGFKMMFSSATKDFNRAIDTERYRTKRVGFHPTWTEQSNIQLPELKAIVDKMVEYGGGWLIVCCHVKDWNKNNWPDNPEMWVDFDDTLDDNGYPIGYAPLNEFISYAKSVGCTFVNVREGYRWIEPYLLDT